MVQKCMLALSFANAFQIMYIFHKIKIKRLAIIPAIQYMYNQPL